MTQARYRIRKQRNGKKWIISRYFRHVGYVAIGYCDTGADALRLWNTGERP